jgi:hypothetical protein
MPAYEAGDYALAARAGRVSIAAGEWAHLTEFIRQRVLDTVRRHHVVAFARLRVRAAALAEVRPVIARARDQCRRSPEAAMARLFLAEAPLAGGLVWGPAAPELAEAAGLVAGLTAELRATRRAV